MISAATLKNIYRDEFSEFFRMSNVQGRSTRIETGIKLYPSLERITKEELAKGGSFAKQLDEFLFSKLFYDINNHQYIYRLGTFFATAHTDCKAVISYLEKQQNLAFNKPLTTKLKNEEYELCTLRIESDNKNCLKNVNLLFRVTNIKTREGLTNFFVGVQVNVKNQYVLFKFNHHFLEVSGKDPGVLIRRLREILNGNGTEGTKFVPLKLSVSVLNEKEPKGTIFQLFKELSVEAEIILNNTAPPGIESEIKSFLTTHGIQDKDSYVSQIKAVVYQDVTKKLAKTIFKDGWVFRFVFREGKHTRASSKTDKLNPIYGTKVYWNLKELIFSTPEMQEAGFHWYLPGKKANGDPDFVQVKLESKHDTMLIHYYYKMRRGRREKEEFVLRKIKKYLL